jgi:hypothetical protein
VQKAILSMFFLISVLIVIAGGACAEFSSRSPQNSVRLEQYGGALIVFGMLFLGFALNESLANARQRILPCEGSHTSLCQIRSAP